MHAIQILPEIILQWIVLKKYKENVIKCFNFDKQNNHSFC